ncbi:osmoprotectant transport system permease protein [Microbacterium trichothecenolyticum]|uniref:ABC transporter permease n=1 Tax=Microbacterium trichothecenolyticum TaxID=69370 RepID=UPI002860C31F|nr:ABC transporter permease [Microbacterium trichothecenolyticum]MDR7111174.1 osmoprotectant transport system permease protein [Microbacterium trichothecenolyticum]
MSWVADNVDLIWALTLDHLRQSAIAIIAGFVLSVPLGWLAFRYTRLRGTVLTVVGLLYTIPSFALFAVLTLFGIPFLSELNLLVALTIYAVAIMTRSVTDGLASVDPGARSAAIAVGFGAWRRFWTVDLPLSGPVVLAGLRVTAMSTISLATVGALIGVQNLGYLFTNGSQRRIIAEVFAGVVAVVIIAVIVDVLLMLAGRALMPWTRRTSTPRPGRLRAVTA